MESVYIVGIVNIIGMFVMCFFLTRQTDRIGEKINRLINMMSSKLKWCIGFTKAVRLRGHSKYRTRKKNIHRVEQMRDKAFRRWGSFPLPSELI